MAERPDPTGVAAVVASLDRVARGDDGRLRATWRVLLAWPVLWFAAGSVGVAAAGTRVPAGATRPARMLVVGLGLALAVALAWVAWARYVDRRPLAGYGFRPARSWPLDLVAGFAAVLVGFAAWLAVAARLDWVSVTVTPSGDGSSLAVGLAAVLVAILVNVWAQETVFHGIALRNGAEGLASRGVTQERAVVGAWVVALALFVLKHRPSTLEAAVPLIVGLGIFGLLYVHTGELALSIGVHAGVNYAGGTLVVPAAAAGDRLGLVAVGNSLSGLGGTLSGGAIPQLLVAYVLLLGWIRWRHGEVGVETDLARRRER